MATNVWLLSSILFVVINSSCEQQQGTSDFIKPHTAAVGRCEEITVPMCKGVGYNLTSMPNELNHDTQDEAGLEVHQFWPLVEIKCSSDLKFFLCSVYVPICIEDYLKPLPACRSVCERARQGCTPIMKQYGFPWPERMACEKLPVHGDPENLCMDKKNINSSNETTAGSGKKPQATKGQTGTKCSKANGKNCFKNDTSSSILNTPIMKDCQCKCKKPLVEITRNYNDGDGSRFYNQGISVGGINNCAFPCQGIFFNEQEKEFSKVWIFLWSGLCFVSTLMTLTTFLIDTDRFKYPERPIVYLSLCYFMVSLGYLLRFIWGHEQIACENNGEFVKYTSNGPEICVMVFLLVYFFGMSSSIWWIILSFTWFLAAGLKWGNEAIANYSQYYHILAWIIPTVKSVIILVLSGVDGDPISGICYVGNQNELHLRIFVLVPLIIYLIVGTSFLLGGFVSLFRIRKVIKAQGGIGNRTKADKLEKLMIRIGIFSVLYTVPATIVIGCYLYESCMYNTWMNSLVCPCSDSNHGIKSDMPLYKPRVKPLYSILMLKYFMTLAVGITSGVWIWSGKTLDSWRRFWRRLLFQSGGGGEQVLIIKDGSGIGGVVKRQQQPAIQQPPPPPLPPASATTASNNKCHYAVSAAPTTASLQSQLQFSANTKITTPLTHV